MDDKSNQWFGASVGSSGPDGILVACAPRYVSFSVNLKRREPVGTCFTATDAFSKFAEYSPCRTAQWGYHRQGYCQAGFSAAVSQVLIRLNHPHQEPRRPLGTPGLHFESQGNLETHFNNSQKLDDTYNILVNLENLGFWPPNHFG